MLTDATIQGKLKRYRSFERICARFHKLWSADARFTGLFSRFSAAVLKLEMIAFTGSSTMNPTRQNNERLVIINPKQLEANMELLIQENEVRIAEMNLISREIGDDHFRKAMNAFAG